jgi:hypothetical protein
MAGHHVAALSRGHRARALRQARARRCGVPGANVVTVTDDSDPSAVIPGLRAQRGEPGIYDPGRVDMGSGLSSLPAGPRNDPHKEPSVRTTALVASQRAGNDGGRQTRMATCTSPVFSGTDCRTADGSRWQISDQTSANCAMTKRTHGTGSRRGGAMRTMPSSDRPLLFSCILMQGLPRRRRLSVADQPRSSIVIASEAKQSRACGMRLPRALRALAMTASSANCAMTKRTHGTASQRGAP